jgi:putative endonuclease
MCGRAVTRSARQGLGGAGERLARHHLEGKGYRFVTANWRCPYGELDLVMRDSATLVFVEVKTRRGERLGAAEESVTRAQARRLLVAAELFLASTPHLAQSIWRVDVLAITLDQRGAVVRLTHFVDAVRAD